jgi:hypothetical protein
VTESSCLKIDHVLLFAPTLSQAMTCFEVLTGVEAQPGGAHPDHGSVNALASMGTSYIELIARADGRGSGSEIEVIGYAMQCDDIGAVAARGAALGLDVHWMDGQRMTSQGTLLRWRSFEFEGHEFAGLLPFFIDWGTTPHPSASSPSGISNPRITAFHPDAEKLALIYRNFGINVPVAAHTQPGLRLDIATPKGVVSFDGDARGWRAALGGLQWRKDVLKSEVDKDLCPDRTSLR